MTNHPHRSKRKVVTYSWTAGGRAQATTISLCSRHDTAENRVGYGQVHHGLHEGQCTICTAAKQDDD